MLYGIKHTLVQDRGSSLVMGTYPDKVATLLWANPDAERHPTSLKMRAGDAQGESLKKLILTRIRGADSCNISLWLKVLIVNLATTVWRE